MKPVELPEDLQRQLLEVGVANPGIAPEILALLLLNSQDDAKVEVGRVLASHLLPHLPEEHPFFR
jgi:hypothetical protein